jgi:hypothetical protein
VAVAIAIFDGGMVKPRLVGKESANSIYESVFVA